jgi:hypothetical protein
MLEALLRLEPLLGVVVVVVQWCVVVVAVAFMRVAAGLLA